MLVDLLAAHSLIQTRPERIAAQDADDEGFVGRGECLGRPLHETRKIVNEDGLNLVLGRCLRAAGTPKEYRQPERAAKEGLKGLPQYRHASLP